MINNDFSRKYINISLYESNNIVSEYKKQELTENKRQPFIIIVGYFYVVLIECISRKIIKA
jgi:hypothetical protein